MIRHRKAFGPLRLAMVLGMLLLCHLTPVGADENLKREQEARYDLNYASYLIEVGKYMEALENYETVVELTSRTQTKIDALLAKATLLSTFLDAPEEALKVYRQVYRDYPEAAEIARYREGLLLYDLDRPDEAKKAIQRYLEKYPQGRFRFQAEALMEQIKKVPPPPPTITPPEVKPPEVKPPVVKPPVVKPPEAKPPEVKAPVVRVRLCKTNGGVTIKGASVCVDGLGCKKQFRITSSNGTLRIDNRSMEEKNIFFEGKTPLGVQCGKEYKEVRGKILAKLKSGMLYIINFIDIEDYLQSVVPSESYASWPLETLKAQAVAARTYALYQARHREDWSYDLVDDAGDQAYKGINREHSKTTRAVNETAGEILTYKGKPILAMFSANSGGYTADAKSIFSLAKPYLVAKPDPESLKGKMARWTKTYPVSQVEAGLNRRGINVQGLERIEPEEKGPSGRIVKVRVVAKNGSKVLRTRTTLRRALNLPEILLEITRKDGQFVFDGRGWGHGVGYSQWGSAILGKKEGYDQILSFYYPNATLEKKW
jgi:stage II sporulation protein D